MPLVLPVTAEQLMAGAREAFMLPENRPRPHSKPRASGIGSCARQQAYSMAATATTNDGGNENSLTTEQGRIVDEGVTQRLFKPWGVAVVNSQITLPDEFPMTGHPDGELVRVDAMDQFMGDGLKWGYEHKNMGRWAYETVFKKGFEQGEPTYLCQTISYGMALEWDAAYVVCLAQDASSVNSDARTNLKAKNPQERWANRPGWNPKLLVYGIDLRQYYPSLGKRLVQRAGWLTDWYNNDQTPGNVAREADPENNERETYTVAADGEISRGSGPDFPCGWCPWLNRCLVDGAGGKVAPELPF